METNVIPPLLLKRLCKMIIVRTRFPGKFISWSWTFVLMLYFCWFDAMWFYLYNLILWFSLDWMHMLDLEEAGHVMFLKLESWKKVCLLKRADLRGKLEETEHKEASIFEDDRLQELGSLLTLGKNLSRPSRVKFSTLTNEENSSIYRLHWRALWAWT